MPAGVCTWTISWARTPGAHYQKAPECAAARHTALRLHGLFRRELLIYLSYIHNCHPPVPAKKKLVSTHREALSLFNRDVRLVLFSQALIGFTIFGGVYTVLLNLYLLRLGYGPQMIGQGQRRWRAVVCSFEHARGAVGQPLGSAPEHDRWHDHRPPLVLACCPSASSLPSSVQLDWIMGGLCPRRPRQYAFPRLLDSPS